jgi:hypothetical protein
MRMLLLCLVVACGSNTEPVKPSEAPAVPARVASVASVEDTAMRFVRAALSGDRATARALVLTADEVMALSNKADRAEWNATVEDTLDRLQREGAGAAGFTVTKAEVVKRKTLTPGVDEKVKREVEVAMVSVVVADASGREHATAWLFFQTAAGWKLSPKQ